MKIVAAFLVSLGLLTGCSVSDGATPAKEVVKPGTSEQQAAVAEAARIFLSRLDKGDVDETWHDASPVIYRYTNQKVWSVGIQTLRDGVGQLRDRKLNGIGFHKAVAGSPPGEYATLVCTTSFSRVTVQEKVVLNLHQGSWKVSGYFLVKKL